MDKYDVIIVGGGIAGLTAAVHLQNEGLNICLLEGSDRVGGRMKTDQIEGFLLDRGFQVLLTAYPEAQNLLDYNALKIKNFYPGSKVYYGDKTYNLADPRRKFIDGLRSVRNPFSNFGDKIKILALKNRMNRLSIEEIFASDEKATIDYLKEWNFSKKMIEAFFKPFLGGIFLEEELSTSSRMFEFVFKMFSSGYASIPKLGIEAIPKQLAEKLKEGTIHLNAKAKRISHETVVTEDEKTYHASSILLATDVSSVNALLPNHSFDDEWNSVRCMYFSAPEAPFKEPALWLNGTGHGWINNIAIPTNLHPGQAPEGKSLVSISIIKPSALDDTDLYTSVRRELKDWFGNKAIEDWTHLRTYTIKKALPKKQNLLISKENKIKPIEKGIFLCGDFTQDSSINGAMRSGRLAADAISWDLALAVNQ